MIISTKASTINQEEEQVVPTMLLPWNLKKKMSMLQVKKTSLNSNMRKSNSKSHIWFTKESTNGESLMLLQWTSILLWQPWPYSSVLTGKSVCSWLSTLSALSSFALEQQLNYTKTERTCKLITNKNGIEVTSLMIEETRLALSISQKRAWLSMRHTNWIKDIWKMPTALFSQSEKLNGTSNTGYSSSQW